MAISKGARIGEYTEKTIVCDRCGQRHYYGAIPKAAVARLAMDDGWVRLDNEGDIWNICPDCGVVPALSTGSQQQENYIYSDEALLRARLMRASIRLSLNSVTNFQHIVDTS